MMDCRACKSLSEDIFFILVCLGRYLLGFLFYFIFFFFSLSIRLFASTSMSNIVSWHFPHILFPLYISCGEHWYLAPAS